jgi:hypothetical protein
MDFCKSVMSEYKNYTDGKDLDTLKWFMTFHGKEASYWYFKIVKRESGHVAMQQLFFEGDTKKCDPVYFSFCADYCFEDFWVRMRDGRSAFEFCFVGELIEDNYSNRIYLIQDIISSHFIECTLSAKQHIIHELIDKVIPSAIDPFLIQVKILYPYDSQTLDIFFKTILISYNVDMEAILVCNDFGWLEIGSSQIIECKNRVNLNMAELADFLSIVPEIKIVNHIMDFYERVPTAQKHNDERTFFTKKDPQMNPDIYYLYESADFSGKYQLALIPSLEVSVKMNEKPNTFTQKYIYHEYHQKWIPVL